jgi:S1-C subfamily serine protease
MAGNSGGALVDGRGRVVGVNTAGWTVSGAAAARAVRGRRDARTRGGAGHAVDSDAHARSAAATGDAPSAYARRPIPTIW